MNIYSHQEPSAPVSTPTAGTGTARRGRHHEADRKALLEAAEEVFARKGFHAASIQEIASAAGVSTGGVYQFVESKANLYLQILDDRYRDYFAALDRAFATEEFDEALTEFTRATVEFCQLRRAFFRMYLTDRPRFTGRFRHGVTERTETNQQRLLAQVASMMNRGIRQGRLRDLDTMFLARGFLSMLDSVLRAAVSNPVGSQMERDAEMTAELFLHGATRTGART